MAHWRSISDDHESPSCGFHCCGKEAIVSDYQVELFKFCPFCGDTLGSKLRCRLSRTPKWLYEKYAEWDEEYNFYHVPTIDFPPETKVFWEIQKRTQFIAVSYKSDGWSGWKREWSHHRHKPLEAMRSSKESAVDNEDNYYTEIEWRAALIRWTGCQRTQVTFNTYQPKWARLESINDD